MLKHLKYNFLSIRILKEILTNLAQLFRKLTNKLFKIKTFIKHLKLFSVCTD